MKAKLTTNALSWMALFALLFCLGSSSSSAQGIFQTVYGGSNFDAAQGGVRSIANSPYGPGFIIVGQSNSFSFNNDYDVYVIFTDPNGSVIWAATYDISGSDFGRKIEQTADSGFVLTGYTENRYNCCTQADIFLMKIDPYGNVSWVKTYGGLGKDLGTDVAVTYDPISPVLTEVYYVSGWTSSFGNGDLDGYLIKTTDLWNVIWAHTYGEASTDYFNSLTVARNGEIIAAGGSNSFSGNLDVFLVRVSPFNGASTFAVYYEAGREEDANAVIELQNGQFASEIVMVGKTYSFGGQFEALIMKVKATGTFLTARIVGDGPAGPRHEEFTDVAELPLIPTTPTSENIVVIGRFFRNPNGFGDFDMFMGAYNAGTCFPPVWERVYGGAFADEGWAVDVAPRLNSSPRYTVIGAGFTYSFPVFGNQEVYVVRANQNGKSGCNDNSASVVSQCVNFHYAFVRFCEPHAETQCQAYSYPYYNYNFFHLCFSPTIAQPVAGHLVQNGLAAPGTVDQTGETLDNSTANVTNTLDRMLLTVAKPNPVLKGRTFEVEYVGTATAATSVTVVDMTGRTVYEQKAEAADGKQHLTISTEGWSAGTYVLNLSSGEKMESRRIIVNN